MDTRTIAVGLVWNERRELLLCRMHPERGVFPGQWGLPGGGIEPGETIEEGLRRELREELGVEVGDVRPAFFKDGRFDKRLPDSSLRSTYMIFLLFHCLTREERVDALTLNEEWVEARWADSGAALGLDLNVETRKTLGQLDAWGFPATY